MGLLSKPYTSAFQLIGSYFNQLYSNPVRTKSISSCLIAALGNYISQRMTKGCLLNQDTFWAFTIFGLLFGGTIPHFFNETLGNFLENSRNPHLQFLIIERLLFTPIYSFFTLYMLSRLEGKNHEDSFDVASGTFPPILEANYKYLTLLQFINIYFVPPILRVFVSDMIFLIWTIYLSKKRQLQNSK